MKITQKKLYKILAEAIAPVVLRELHPDMAKAGIAHPDETSDDGSDKIEELLKKAGADLADKAEDFMYDWISENARKYHSIFSDSDYKASIAIYAKRQFVRAGLNDAQVNVLAKAGLYEAKKK